LQFVFEEKVMTADAFQVPPLLLFGMEGFWGTLICSVVLTPIAMWIPGPDNGSFESPYTTWALLANTWSLQVMFALYIGTIFAYNLFAVLSTLLRRMSYCDLSGYLCAMSSLLITFWCLL
jgi:hypothetical protein